MTTATDSPARVCEMTGLYRRDCTECPECDLLREEVRELFAAKADVFLSNRDERERDRRLEIIEREIERYSKWL